jgi:large subunit ribosomal protein L33
MCKEGGRKMAKKENREGVALQCSVCKEMNYLTSKNKKNVEGKLEMKKFCPKCNKTTLHKEKKA